MKFCKLSNRFVIIFIKDSVSSSCGCNRCLNSTDNLFYRDIAAITTLWPVECFKWSMEVYELDIYIILLLINFVHQTDPPQQVVHARDVMSPISTRVGIWKSWISTNESSSLHSLCPICDADWGIKWWLLLVPGTVLPSLNLFSKFSLTSTMSSLSMPKRIIDFISSWHTSSTAR